MATGSGIGIDLGGLEQTLKKISTEMTSLVNAGRSAENALIQNFKNVAKNGISPLLSDLGKLTTEISNLGGKGGNSGKGGAMANINKESQQAIDKANRFAELMAKINNDGASGRRSSAVTKINEEIETAKKRLAELQQTLNFYTKGEGKKAVGFVDTSATQKEARELMVKLDLLEREKSSLQANERLRLELAKRNEQRANNWVQMENEKRAIERNNAKQSSDAAKARSEAYKRSYDEQYRMYEQMFNKIAQKEAQQQSSTRAAYANLAMKNGMTTSQHAMNYNQRLLNNTAGVASLQNMNASIQKMRDAQQQLNQKTTEGRKRYQELEKEIKRTEAAIAASTGKLGEFIRETQRSTGAMSQLKSKVAMAFSVQAIWNFVKNLANVTGQMELQHKALQAIVQDKYKADEIWAQTMQNALKSPFSISQILEHTKKLAAYRIEADKLVETTRMLGDISAGVGVDMNRLVLAYGQVRAATYLRASELRQFTEAGIPLLDELANYFTRLEGKAVTTGEVFSRISDKAVAFKDVETVIKQMTDEGGVFFKMQEIQSETLAGKIAKLKDSYTLMLNEIGTANNSTLVNAVDKMQVILNSWEKFAPIVKGILFGIMVKGIAGVIVNFGALIGRIRTAQTATAALGKTMLTVKNMSTGGWLAIVGIVVSLGTAIWNACTATDELTRKLGEVDSDVEKDLNESKEMFAQLADEIRSSTASYKDREEALSKLQRKYKDILPDYMLELEYLKNMEEGYKNVNTAMELFYANEARKKKEALINEEYDQEIEKWKKNKSGRITTYKKEGALAKTPILADEEANAMLLEKTMSLLETGQIKADEFKEALTNAFREFYNLSQDAPVSFRTSYYRIIDLVEKKAKALNNIEIGFYDTPEQKKNKQAIQDYLESFDEVQDRYKLAEEHVKKYYELLSNPPKKDPITADMTDEQKSTIEKSYNTAMEAYNTKLEDAKASARNILGEGLVDGATGMFVKGVELSADKIDAIFASADKGAVELDKKMHGIGINMYNSFQQGVTGAKEVVDYMGKVSSSAKEALEPKQWQDSVTEIQKSIFDIHGVTMQQLDGANAYAMTSLSDYTQQLHKMFADLSNTKIQMKISSDTFKQLGLTGQAIAQIHKLKFGGQTEEEVDKKLKAVEELLHALGEKTKKDKTTKKTPQKSDDRISRYKDAESFIKKVGERVEDFSKYMSEEEAINKVKTIYEKTAKDVFKGLNLSFDSLDFKNSSKSADAMKKNLEKLYTAAEKAGKGAKGLDNYLRDLKVTINEYESKKTSEQIAKNLEQTVQSIEDQFSSYELFVSLEASGVSKDFAKQFFGIDAFSLNEIREQLQSKIGEFRGDEGAEEYQKLLKKITESEQKERNEYLKKFLEDSKDAMSEAAKIKLQLVTDLKNIDKAFASQEGETQSQKTYREQLKQEAQKGANMRANEALRKVEWEEFINSETFIKLMGDLENVSVEVLKNLRDQLEKYKDAWKDTPEIFDDVIKKSAELEEALFEKLVKNNPFKAFKDVNKFDKENRKGRTDDQIADDNKRLVDENKKLNDEIAEKEAGLRTLQENIATKQQILSIAEASGDYEKKRQAEENLRIASNAYAAQKNDIEQTKKQIEQNQNLIDTNNKLLDSSKKKIKALNGQKEMYGRVQQTVNEFGSALSELWEVFGEGDDVTGLSLSFATDMADSTMRIIEMVIQTRILSIELQTAGAGAEALGAKLNMALGIIGWITMAIQLVAKVFKFIKDVHDTKIENDIESYQKKIENLEKAYESLEEAIEKAYSSADLHSNYDEALRNLESRIEYERAILEAEQGKKDKDQDAIDEARDAIDELRKQQKELLEDTASDLGAIYDVRDATQGFVEAWMDAFQETGNGLKGLKDNFKETFRDIMLQQAVMTGAGQIMKPFYDSINEALENDFKIDETEYKKINKTADQQLSELDAFMQSFYEKYPDVFDAASELSGLQAGIEGITEQQAEVISAYLNSIRFFVHSIDENTKRLADNGLNGNAVTAKMASVTNESIAGNVQQDENPMLSQIQMLVEQTRAINDLLGSVTRVGHPKGGYGLKVFID